MNVCLACAWLLTWTVLLVDATFPIDTSNIDPNFQYFQYPTRRPLIWRSNFRRPPPSPMPYRNPIVDTFQRFKAVLTYLKSLVFGHPIQKEIFHIKFDPEAGKRASVDYQRRYGKNGERLVEALGMGLPRAELVRIGVIPPNYPPF